MWQNSSFDSPDEIQDEFDENVPRFGQSISERTRSDSASQKPLQLPRQQSRDLCLYRKLPDLDESIEGPSTTQGFADSFLNDQAMSPRQPEIVPDVRPVGHQVLKMVSIYQDLIEKESVSGQDGSDPLRPLNLSKLLVPDPSKAGMEDMSSSDASSQLNYVEVSFCKLQKPLNPHELPVPDPPKAVTKEVTTETLSLGFATLKSGQSLSGQHGSGQLNSLNKSVRQLQKPRKLHELLAQNPSWTPDWGDLSSEMG